MADVLMSEAEASEAWNRAHRACQNGSHAVARAQLERCIAAVEAVPLPEGFDVEGRVAAREMRDDILRALRGKGGGP